MKRKLVFAALIITTCVLICLFLIGRCQRAPVIHASTAFRMPTAHSFALNSSSSSGAVNTGKTTNDVEAEKRREQEIWNLGLTTPIRFYGKVVDDNGNPIPHATAKISMADHLWKGNTKMERITDANGLFSVSGHGLGITVMVSKRGYYNVAESGGSFGYASGAGSGRPHPDPKDPAIFLLKKMGKTAALVYLADKDISPPKNGVPIELSLETGKVVQNGLGDLRVQVWIGGQDPRQDANQPYDWLYRISVPGGGLLPRQGEFDFEAPFYGYQPFDEIDMFKKIGAQWRSQLSKQYFLQLRNGNYARLDFTVSTANALFITITSYLNPTPGDRNLEFDPAKQIKVK